MSELIVIKLNDIKKNKKFSDLVPEMSEQEFKELVESIKKYGVRQPIHVLTDNTILDGRHRVRSCKELGIKEIQALQHDLTEAEAIQFVTDTAVERRNLRPEQKIDIVLRSEALIKSLEEEAKKNSMENLRHSSTGSEDPIDKKGRTNEKIAELTGTSPATVMRIKKVKKEDPDKYQEVLAGKKTITGAYNELPNVSGTNQKRAENKNKHQKESQSSKNEEYYKNITREESEQSIAYENLIFNLRQLDMYLDENKNRLTDAIRKAYQDTPDLIEKSISNMEMLTNFIKENKEN